MKVDSFKQPGNTRCRGKKGEARAADVAREGGENGRAGQSARASSSILGNKGPYFT